MRRLKLRAVHDGRKLKDVAADMLRKGIGASPVAKKMTRARFVKDKTKGLPIIPCGRVAPRGREMTPRRVARVLSDQEVEWARESA